MMNALRCLAVFFFFWGCNPSYNGANLNHSAECGFMEDTIETGQYPTGRQALLATRIPSLEALKSVIQIEYHASGADSFVCLYHCSGGKAVTSILKTGVSQGDFNKARNSDALGDRLSLLFRSPYAVANRKDLEKVFLLSRWDPRLFGQGDVAYFDLAKQSAGHINTPDLAFLNPRDSTEKGYINSFNHITAQALITTCFSEEMADFIADAHERHHHPELITGKFTEAQIKDLDEGPVDNYVDMVNNEWGQEIGKQLKEKYHLHRETHWTPELLADYLNDLQHYYSRAFQVGFEPFRREDELLRRFSEKMNTVMQENL